jgi:hypothetical protein
MNRFLKDRTPQASHYKSAKRFDRPTKEAIMAPCLLRVRKLAVSVAFAGVGGNIVAARDCLCGKTRCSGIFLRSRNNTFDTVPAHPLLLRSLRRT